MWGVFLNLFYCLCRLCSSNSLEMESSEPTNSEDPNSMASSSVTSPPVGDYEGETRKPEGNDYEVFLSFRGKDTRKGFTDYLYTSLVDAGIHVFRDDNELRVGEEIGSELLNSIKRSKICIPIISEDYASSKWCLRELTYILKCKRNGGQIVLPIFYKVKPSLLRNPAGIFRDAINAHKKNMDKMVTKEWEEALEEVSSLKGWESEKDENGYEGALVKTVVNNVMSHLKRLFLLNVPKELVGIDDRVHEIRGKIDAKFNGTWIIGIYGMGGIGKTTLAKVLYNELSSHFEACCFLADIRETSNRNGIKCLQEQLISNIIGISSSLSHVDEGIDIIKSRFTSKKIIVLLDDMDDIAHLNALAGDHGWFKAGSIVIITTRNKRILDEARTDHMYQLDKLPLDKSLILFSRHAFWQDSPPSAYDVVSRDVVSTTGGLPLALKIIGSFLCRKMENVWKDTLKKLKKVPDKKVQETLRISYDALEYEEKQIFLDIACFFIGWLKQYPIYMWDGYSFFPENGIEVLSLMSLIKIDERGILLMHDQLRDLGRQIVRQENEREPQRRSRLWINEEATDVIDNNKGTSKIEALRLHKNYREGNCTGEKFKELTNLRFLQVTGVNLVGDFQNELSQLRWLKCVDSCLDFEVVNFRPKNLIVLQLCWSQISEDWRGWDPLKMATKLKVLDLTCVALRTTPDLSAFRILEILNLKDCKDLEEIHPSINDIKTLVSLNVGGCWKLKELPLRVGCLRSLSFLDLTGCDKLAQLPYSIGSLEMLQQLFLSGCHLLREIPASIGKLESLIELRLKSTAIKELPGSVGSLKKLKTLDVSYCASLGCIPSSISLLMSLSFLDLTSCVKLAQLPDSIGSFVMLQRLLLSGCHLLREIPVSIGKLESLIELRLIATAIEELPDSIGSLRKLKILDASYCASLAHIPSSIGHLTSLSTLILTGCSKLAQLPDSVGSLEMLQHLFIAECHSLIDIPTSIGKLESLIELQLRATGVEKLPDSMGFLKKLKILSATDCASLAHIPSYIGHLASLSFLSLRRCGKITQLPDSIGSLTSLRYLLLTGCHLLREIPDSIGKLESLIFLCLKDTAVIKLPESIGNMQNLKLDISGSPFRELFDDRGILAKLQELRGVGGKNPEGPGEMVLPDNLDLDKLRKLSELRSRVLALVLLKHPSSSPANNSAMDYETADSEHGLMTPRHFGISDEPPAITIFGSGNATVGTSLGDRGAPVAAKESGSMADVKPRMADESGDKSRIGKPTEIIRPSQCRSIRLPDNLTATRSLLGIQEMVSLWTLMRLPVGKGTESSRDEFETWQVSRLIYTNSGHAILALSSNAEHKFWTWQRSHENFRGKATTSVVPQLWGPPRGNLMINDTSDTNPEDAVSCFALSKHDTCLMSASGGEISWFNLMNFKREKKIMLRSSAPTILVSHPQDNSIIAIGMEDSSIQIDNVRVDEKKLKGKRVIQGFDFPTFFTVLVSSGADSQTMTTFVPARQVATFLAFFPRDDNIIAIGTEDSSIRIFNWRFEWNLEILRGHQKRITGLAFSNVLNVLVSSGADSQLCVWSTGTWKKQASKFLQMPIGRGVVPLADSRVQFHKDQIDLLVVHETQIAIYEAPKLECLQQWVTRDASCPITDATYSCNGQSVYVSFEDGNIGVFTASKLTLRCRINPAAYIPPNPSLGVYPLVIAAHPYEPNQFALGLTDGSVYVLEPLESEGKWGTSPPVENGDGPSTTSGATASDQPQR